MLRSIESAGVAPLFAMAKKKKPGAAPDATTADADQATRLKRIEMACGFETSAGFAAFIGIEPRRWYNFLNGMPISRDVAFRLVQRVPGLTTDYIFFGNPGGLTIELARRLGVFGPPET